MMNLAPPALVLPALDRRTLLKGMGAGLVWTSLMGCSEAVQVPGTFTHGVASGEPGQDRMMLWTRFLSDGQDARLDVEVSPSEDFGTIVSGASLTADPGKDYCAKVMVDGLAPGRTYYYRFIAPDGTKSMVGRTRTLPGAGAERFRVGLFSCANVVRGYFNAYAHANAADDIDLALHVGDYYYEVLHTPYAERQARGLGSVRGEEGTEAHTLQGYRDILSTYRQDQALQRLHQLFPMVMMWDDHEIANNAWRDGADGHDPATEGDWSVRKRAAMQAVREWLPLSDEAYTRYEIGDLATLLRPETRLVGRDRPLVMPRGNRPGVLDDFRAVLNDPARTMLGMEQEAWLHGAIANSARSGTRWQVVANQVPMDLAWLPPGLDWEGPGANRRKAQRQARRIARNARERLPTNLDKWDGYPAARARLYEAALGSGANLVALSGDVHNAYAYELSHMGERVGVDIVTTSVSSNGKERSYNWIPAADMARETVAFNDHLAWADTQHRGYTHVDIRRDEIRTQYRFTPSIKEASASLVATHDMRVPHGARRFA